MLERSGHHIVEQGHAFEFGLPPKQYALTKMIKQPRAAPVDLSQRDLQFGLRAAADVHHHGTKQAPRQLDRIRHLRSTLMLGRSAVGTDHHAAALGQRPLRCRAKVLQVPLPVGPGCCDSEWPLAFLTHQHQGSARALDTRAQEC